MGVTQKELADYLSLSRRRVATLVDEGVIPGAVNGTGYDLKDCVKRYVDYKAGREGELDLSRERALLARSQRERVDLDIAIKRGSVVKTEVAQEVVGKIVEAFRAKVLALPTRAAPEVVALDGLAEVTEVLTRLCHDALTECASPDLVRAAVESVELVDGDNGDCETPAKVDGQPVGRPKKTTKP
jgi:phage terminase Nu1 subunit (DNA packaging protein)